MRESGNDIDWDWEGTTNLDVGMRVNRYTITRVYFLPNSVANYLYCQACVCYCICY